jgi:hypothetical protein
VFDSFAAVLTIEMALEDVALNMSGEGTWVTDAFGCELTTGIGGLDLTQSLVATPETMWLDSGSGYEPTPLFGGAAQEVMSMCPASPIFWRDFTSDGLGRPQGEVAEIDGRSAIKADLTEVVGQLGGFGGVPGLEEAEINEMVMWIDEETNVVLALNADLRLGEDFLQDIGAPADGTGDVAMLMSFRVERVNDPSLAVPLPGS